MTICATKRENMQRIQVGVSACLLGEKVRYDGGHKANPYLISTLGHLFSWVPLCPEKEAGLGVPREPIRIVKNEAGNLKLIGATSRKDVTEKLTNWIENKLPKLANFSGFILKGKSPSCGVRQKATVYDEEGRFSGKSMGLFAQKISEAFPFIPITDESIFKWSLKLQGFLEEVGTYERFCLLKKRGITPASLRDFHKRHRLLIKSHSPRILLAIDSLIAELEKEWKSGLEDVYYSHLKSAFHYDATPPKHLRCLLDLKESLKEKLSISEKIEVESKIEEFNKGSLPLSFVLPIFARLVKKYNLPSYRRDVYLFSPLFPMEGKEERR